MNRINPSFPDCTDRIFVGNMNHLFKDILTPIDTFFENNVRFGKKGQFKKIDFSNPGFIFAKLSKNFDFYRRISEAIYIFYVDFPEKKFRDSHEGYDNINKYYRSLALEVVSYSSSSFYDKNCDKLLGTSSTFHDKNNKFIIFVMGYPFVWLYTPSPNEIKLNVDNRMLKIWQNFKAIYKTSNKFKKI